MTLPKVTQVEQVEAMVRLPGGSRTRSVCPPGALRFEMQVETPQSILGPDGTALVARMIHAGAGRVTALHYGTYDYSAFCGIAADYQCMEHPVADHAKAVMQAAAAGTGVRLSDGSTNVLPVGDADEVRARLGAARPAGPPLARARLLPGLGPASGPAAHPLRRDLRLLPRGLRRGGRAAAQLRAADRVQRRWTSRPPPGPCRTSSCAAWTARRSRPPR